MCFNYAWVFAWNCTLIFGSGLLPKNRDQQTATAQHSPKERLEGTVCLPYRNCRCGRKGKDVQSLCSAVLTGKRQVPGCPVSGLATVCGICHTALHAGATTQKACQKAAGVLWRVATDSDKAKLEAAKAGAVAPAVVLLNAACRDLTVAPVATEVCMLLTP